MNELITEKIINRARFILILFFFSAAFSAYKTSIPAVYNSLFIAVAIYLLLAIVNHFFIKKQTLTWKLIYASVTVEVLLVFYVKYAFHYDPYNGFGLALKEPATFIIWFILGIISGLRYNKRLNIYFGVLTILCYMALVVMGLAWGGMTFTDDPEKIFTPFSLRFATEFAKVLFLGANAYFLYIMADFTSKTVNKLFAAKAETDNILTNVKEGLFLINSGRAINENYSGMLEKIFERENLAGTNFVDLIKELVDEKEIAAVQDFIDISFTKKLTESRLAKLNPMSRIMVTIKKEGAIIEKYLSFSFARIQGEDMSQMLLATVQDITDEVNLAEQIKISEKRAHEEMELLFGIIHINPVTLNKFINEAGVEIQELEKNLEEAKFSKDLRGLLSSLNRSIHSIKGNASQLGLDIFADRAHNLEDAIKILFDKKDLSVVDFIGLLYSIIDLKNSLIDVHSLLEKITAYQDMSCKDAVSDFEILTRTIMDVAAKTAERDGKKVEVLINKFMLPEKESLFYMSSLKKILIQIIKNSVNHGIETGEERISSGKGETGLIEVSSKIKDEALSIEIKDDGRGIDIEKLKERAIEMGKHSSDEISLWPKEKITQLIFEPGFSTSKNVTIDAGRGIGLDIVRHIIHNLRGRVRVISSPGKYTIFDISLPLSPQQN